MSRGLDAPKVAPGAQRTPPGWIRDEVRASHEEGACAVCRSTLYIGDTCYRDGAGAAVCSRTCARQRPARSSA